MQRFPLHSHCHHLNKDCPNLMGESADYFHNFRFSTIEALVLFICYNDMGCRVIKMPYMIRLVRKSENRQCLDFSMSTET